MRGEPIMTSKILFIDPLKCDGCKDCETACAARHAGYRKIARKRIEVKAAGAQEGSTDVNLFVPFTCQQCVDPPCLAVCPKKAITRDPNLARVVIDPKLCVGCKMCVAACPTGSMTFAPDVGFPYKCELCDGDPECVRVCKRKALEYVEPHRFQRQRAQESAARLCSALQARRT